MTTPHDNHAAPAATPAADAAAKKITPTQKIWNLVMTVIGVGVGLVVLFILGSELLTMAVDSFNLGLQKFFTSASQAMSNLGIGLSGFLRSTSTAVARTVNAAIGVLILPLVAFLVGRLIWLEYKKSKGGGGDDHGGHPPAAH